MEECTDKCSIQKQTTKHFKMDWRLPCCSPGTILYCSLKGGFTQELFILAPGDEAKNVVHKYVMFCY